MKNFTLKENEKLTAEIIDGCAVFTIEEKKKEFKGKLMEEEPVFEAGKWYKNIEFGNLIFCRDPRNFCGFQYSDKEWYDEMPHPIPQRFKPADMEEVEKLMIAEAEKRGYKGGKFKNKYNGEFIRSIYNNIDTLIKDGELRVYIGQNTIYTDSTGWAEIIEPLFINSHGTRFYEGDQRHYQVRKSDNTICGPYYNRSFKESSLLSEALTKEQAEQYVKDNRVFEDGAFYEVVRAGDTTLAEHVRGYFFMTGEYRGYKSSDFESIGKKITF